MTKPYSNKALPAGTVLREWRLEQVLGVGGFGIVYKGKGIYFDELVAIKEYFPSSISDRDENDTVVPIDSDAEEVHALGLKKFVEEAKLLWNLSTPTRHPNIVSVRSLFEVHGTAYMVMDFEDGVALSKLLKQGKKFNEESLTALVLPIAEGLERAHRVGVLHRDIKPPNILVNVDGRPVLIDFGSARFESGSATSTKVTFHTPPYAAIEQYVKTYEQGPWTDIYALGVVLYECVTGQKPPEVLERLHGGLGTALAEGDWPGFSETFLRAVDAAMVIRPEDRPQSVGAWVEMFKPDYDGGTATSDLDDDEDATRFVPFADVVPHIAPAAGQPSSGQTNVPSDTGAVQFKGAGQETGTGMMAKVMPEQVGMPPAPPLSPPAIEEMPAAGVEPAQSTDRTATAEVDERTNSRALRESEKSAGAAQTDKKIRPALIGAIGVAGILIFVGGWYFARQNAGDQFAIASAGDDSLVEDAGEIDSAEMESAKGLLATMATLGGEARAATLPATPLRAFTKSLDDLQSLGTEYEDLAGDSNREARAAKLAEMQLLARTASVSLTKALAADADAKARQIARIAPWADPRRADAAKGESAANQRQAVALRQARIRLASAAETASVTEHVGEAIAAAREAIAAGSRFATAHAVVSGTAVSDKAGKKEEAIADRESPTPTPIPPAETSTPSGTTEAEEEGDAESAIASRVRQFDSVHTTSKDIANKVIAMAKGSKPGGNASDKEKQGYALRQQNADTARGYLDYLQTASRAIRNAKSISEADQMVSQANTTKRYLTLLLSRSAGTQ